MQCGRMLVRKCGHERRQNGAAIRFTGKEIFQVEQREKCKTKISEEILPGNTNEEIQVYKSFAGC